MSEPTSAVMPSSSQAIPENTLQQAGHVVSMYPKIVTGERGDFKGVQPCYLVV